MLECSFVTSPWEIISSYPHPKIFECGVILPERPCLVSMAPHGPSSPTSAGFIGFESVCETRMFHRNWERGHLMRFFCWFYSIAPIISACSIFPLEHSTVPCTCGYWTTFLWLGCQKKASIQAPFTLKILRSTCSLTAWFLKNCVFNFTLPGFCPTTPVLHSVSQADGTERSPVNS